MSEEVILPPIQEEIKIISPQNVNYGFHGNDVDYNFPTNGELDEKLKQQEPKIRIQSSDQDEKANKEKILKETEQLEKQHKFTALSIIYGTQLGIAVFTGIIIAILLILINPPITQIQTNDPNVSSNQSWSAVLIVVIIVILIVFFAPILFLNLKKFIEYRNNNKKNK